MNPSTTVLAFAAYKGLPRARNKQGGRGHKFTNVNRWRERFTNVERWNGGIYKREFSFANLNLQI